MFAAFIVACLCALAWLFIALLNHFLGEENLFGQVTVTPYGYERVSLLNQRWDSVKVSGPNFELVVRNPEFKFSKSDSLFLRVHADEVDVFIEPSGDSSTTPTKIPEIPNLTIPFMLGADAGKVTVHVKGAGEWEAGNVVAGNPGKTSLKVSASEISGTHVPESASFEAKANWDENNINLKVQAASSSDTVALAAKAPRTDLTKADLQADVRVQALKKWVPSYPASAPQLSKISVTAKARNDRKFKYDAVVKLHTAARYPLPPLDHVITLKGDTSKVDLTVNSKAKNGAQITAEGRMNYNLDFEARGEVKNMWEEFGPQRMPMDAKILSARKKGDTIYVVIDTKSGSHVKGRIMTAPHLTIDYTGDMAKDEVWCVKWSKGRLVFDSRPQVVGHFDGQRMYADFKVKSIPYCYFMKADSLHTSLWLNTDEIHFTSGTIFGKRETFDFTGEVVWDGHGGEEYTAWEVKATDGGSARAKVDINYLKVEADADGVLFSGIPFAKDYLPEWADARITGIFEYDLEADTAFTEAYADAQLQAFTTQAELSARMASDTISISRLVLRHGSNTLEGFTKFVLPGEDYEGALPVELINAGISTRSFNIPLSLLPLNDSTFSDGEFSGDLTYTDSHGLHGDIEFSNIAFRKIPKNVLSIQRMNLFAERAKAELDAYLEIGNGAWSGTTQISFDQLLAPKKRFSFIHITNNGGNIWGDGYLDSVVTSNIHMDGYWLLPSSVGELKSTDLHVSVEWLLTRGLNGLTATFFADSTVYSPLALNLEFPIALEGEVSDKKLNVTRALTRNGAGDSIEVALSYAIDELRLKELKFWTDKYTITHGKHDATVRNLEGTLSENDYVLTINAKVPSLEANMNSDSYGQVEARAHGDFSYVIPKTENYTMRLSNKLEGEVWVDKLLYKKDVDINITPKTVVQLTGTLQNFLTGLRRKKTGGEAAGGAISTSKPTDLNIRILDSQQDSLAMMASFAEFPFTLDLNVRGQLSKPLLQGEVANSGEGFVGFKGLYEFEIQQFLVSWQNVPWQQGSLEISISQDLPYCTETDDNENETCPVSIDVQGTITNPQPTPHSYCGTETSTSALYYNIFLGCVTESQADESVDWNKLAGTALGKMISSAANRTLGGNYIGNIDMKMKIFSDNDTQEEDSSYVKIPISLDRWIKNMSVILGYTKDQSENPTYEQAFEFGINYKLPVFQDKAYSHDEHLNPTLSLDAMLVSKQYHVNTGTQENENMLEKNVGLNYTYKFWMPCFLGIGNCKEYEDEE